MPQNVMQSVPLGSMSGIRYINIHFQINSINSHCITVQSTRDRVLSPSSTFQAKEGNVHKEFIKTQSHAVEVITKA